MGIGEWLIQPDPIYTESTLYHSVVVSSWLMTPDTIGPRIIARPCPANPKDTNLTPMYSVGIMVLFSGF